MVEIKIISNERVLERNLTKFDSKTKAKEFRSWLTYQIGKATYKKDVETELILKGVQRAYNHYNPIISQEVVVDSWKGKSSLEVLQEPDKYIIIKYQRPEKGAEPKEIRLEVPVDEMAKLKQSILFLWQGLPLTTDDVAREWSRRMGLIYNSWNSSMFTKRSFHNKFTKMLGALDKLEAIDYRGGKIILQ